MIQTPQQRSTPARQAAEAFTFGGAILPYKTHNRTRNFKKMSRFA